MNEDMTKIFKLVPTIINGEKAIKITGLKTNAKEVTIPSKINGLEVILKDDAFYLNKTCEKVIIEDGITEIPGNCFRTSNIKEVVLPKSVTNIKINAFDDSHLNTINLENVEHIETFAFNNTKIKEANLKKIKTLGSNVFCNCKHLNKVTLSDKITDIREGTFQGSDIKEIDLKEVTNIGRNTFADCKNLERIKGNMIKELEHPIFTNCKNLRRVTLLNLEKMSKDVFIGCHIEKLMFYNKVKIDNAICKCSIDEVCFNNEASIYNSFLMSNIKKLSFYKDAEIDVSFKCSNIEEVIFKKEVTMCDVSFSNSKINSLNIYDKIDYMQSPFDTATDYSLCAINIYSEKSDIDDINLLARKNSVVNIYKEIDDDLSYKNYATKTTQKKLLDKGFNLSRTNQILKAQEDNLLLSCIPNDTDMDVLRNIIKINKENKALANEIKSLLMTKDDLDNMIKMYTLINDFLEEKDNEDKNIER